MENCSESSTGREKRAEPGEEVSPSKTSTPRSSLSLDPHPALIPGHCSSLLGQTPSLCQTELPHGVSVYLRWWQPSPLPAGGPSPPAASPAPAGAAAAGPRSSSGASPPWLQSPFHMLPARGTRGRGWPGSAGAGITEVGEPLGSHTPAGGGHPASITRVFSLHSQAEAG